MQTMKVGVFGCIALAALLFLAGCSSNPNQGTTDKPTAAAKPAKPALVIGHLPVFGSPGRIDTMKFLEGVELPAAEAMVYEVVDYTFNKEVVEPFGRRLLQTTELKLDSYNNAYFMYSADGQVEIDSVTGSYQYLTKAYIEETYGDLTERLADAEYIKRSEKFLLGHNIAFESLDLEKPRVGEYMTAEITDKDGRSRTVVRLIGVYYHRKPLDDVKFWGVGPRLVVVFDNSGEIVKVNTAWRDFAPFETYELVGWDVVEARISEGRYSCSDTTDGRVTIDGVALVYITEALGHYQEYLVPTYKLGAMDGTGNRTEIFVQALKDENVIEQELFLRTPMSETHQEAKRGYTREEAPMGPQNTDPLLEQDGARKP